MNNIIGNCIKNKENVLGHNTDRYKEIIQIKIYHKEELGKRIVYHMYGSSSIKYIDGKWKLYWEKETSDKNINISFFDNTKIKCDCCKEDSTEFVGCHVIDKDTGEIFIYPCCKKCNDSVKGVEKDNPFYANESLLVPMKEEAVDSENLDESLEELRKEALERISPDEDSSHQ